MHKQYLVTERAHLMCPNMQFGILVKINATFDEGKLESVLKNLQSNHPFLHSKIASENNTGKLYYNTDYDEPISYTIKDESSEIMDDYNAIISNGWNAFDEGLLKVVIYPSDKNYQILFISHHLLCDGRGLLGLVLEYADLYVDGKEPAYVEETLIQSYKDLPSKSDMPFLSKYLIKRVNKHWLKEGHKVDYREYRDFEKQYLENNPTSYEIKTKEGKELADIIKQCKENQISINDYLVANMM